MLTVFAPKAAAAATAPQPMVLASGWQLQDAAKVPQTGEQIASPGFDTRGWHAATVPGTVLTTLVNDHVYPEPLYGENNRPEIIPESLCHTSYWYRTVIRIPKAYRNRHVWLNFDGINYSAAVWVNGAQVGTIRGAFIRGTFDITAQVKPGEQAVVAVLVAPQPHPGGSARAHAARRRGPNGGITAIDGPTFLVDHRLGLARRGARSRHGHLAKGVSLGHGAGGAEGSAGDHRSAAAQDRFG